MTVQAPAPAPTPIQLALGPWREPPIISLYGPTGAGKTSDCIWAFAETGVFITERSTINIDAPTTPLARNGSNSSSKTAAKTGLNVGPILISRFCLSSFKVAGRVSDRRVASQISGFRITRAHR